MPAKGQVLCTQRFAGQLGGVRRAVGYGREYGNEHIVLIGVGLLIVAVVTRGEANETAQFFDVFDSHGQAPNTKTAPHFTHALVVA
jgi:hypothetical protein